MSDRGTPNARTTSPPPRLPVATTEGDVDRTVAQPRRWLEQHGQMLYKFALLRLRDAHVAEDVVQETLLCANRGFADFRNESSIRTWLFAILRNEIRRHLRTRQRRERLISAAGPCAAVPLDQLLTARTSNSQFANSVEREEFWEIIQGCYEQLPSHLLDAFLYRLANPHEKLDQLCRALDIKESNLSVRLFRARLILRDCIERTWLDES